jgi:hypothetical protein
MTNLSNKAFLIRKEKLKRNFKLTFASKNGKEYFLILHEDKKNIYNQLSEKHYYYYQRKRGLKYSFITFINCYSEWEITPAQQETINKRNQELKTIFINQITQGLKKKKIINNIEELKHKISQRKPSNSSEYVLNWIENLLISYWLEMKQQTPQQKTIISKRVEKIISKLSALFMTDYLYNENCQWIDKKEVFCPDCWKTQEHYLTKLIKKGGFN